MLFQYTKLAGDSIRLVSFDRKSTPTDISLTLHHQDKYYDRSVRYMVLAYAHDQQESKSLTLHGRNRLVPAPVWEALSVILRQGHANDQRFWIDVLCVNQRDDVEKAMHEHQLSRIYQCAAKVIVWCGRSDASNVAVLELVRRIAQDGPTGTSVGKGQVSESEKIAVQRVYDGIAAVIDMGNLERAQTVVFMWDRYTADLKWFDVWRARLDVSGTDPAKGVNAERAAL